MVLIIILFIGFVFERGGTFVFTSKAAINQIKAILGSGAEGCSVEESRNHQSEFLLTSIYVIGQSKKRQIVENGAESLIKIITK